MSFYKVIASLHVMLLFLVTTSAAVAQDADLDARTDERKQLDLESFDYMWQMVKDHYWDAELGGVDWESVRDELRPKLEKAESVRQARRIMREMLNRMGVSHFGVVPAEAYEKIQTSFRGHYYTGMDVRVVEGQALVTDVFPDSPADKLGVKRGWLVKKIGDTDIETRLKEISEELKDHAHLRTILVDATKARLRGAADDKIEFVFLDGDDQDVSLSIPLIEERGKLAKFGHIPEFRIWIDTRKLDNNIGYIRFNAFMDPTYVMRQYNEAIAEFKDCQGIVIDVRGNGGGLGPMATGMMGWFLNGDTQQMGTIVIRENRLKMLVHPRPNPYERPVAVLIDESSVSAAEFFASGINDLQLGRLFGTRTAGASLGSSFERLPNGDGFQYPRANYISKSTDNTLEGIGVPPHEEVHHSRKALLNGVDLQLQKAIEWIQSENSND